MALSNAERQRAYRERAMKEVFGPNLTLAVSAMVNYRNVFQFLRRFVEKQLIVDMI